MKKIIAIVMTVLLCIIASISVSEEIDISLYSSDELAALLPKIYEKIGTPVGGYLFTGKDIKEGGYVFSNFNEDEVAIVVYSDLEHYNNNSEENLIWLKKGESATIVLEGENVLYITYGTAYMLPVEKPSWKP